MARLFQFSIRSLLVAVTIAAVGIAALLNANHWWEAATWLVALGLLAVGILLCIYRREEQRAYWLGFVIFGGLYLGLVLITSLVNQYHDMLPTQLLHLAYDKVIPLESKSEYTQPPGAFAPATTAVTTYSYRVIATPQGPYASPPPAAYIPPPLPAAAPNTATPWPVAAWVPNAAYVPVVKFISIGHSLCLLLAAAIGGKICQWICRTQSPRTDSSP
ncbi:MAG TPA: hypothetical protein VMP01_27610 [Pirellulaceae bacterium]|nr:hypothetical protein [Pirellulaceae bacterium]